MPRLDHRKLESLISPGGVPALQGDGEVAVRRRRRVVVALAVQLVSNYAWTAVHRLRLMCSVIPVRR